jgi:hypothetical protein
MYIGKFESNVILHIHDRTYISNIVNGYFGSFNRHFHSTWSMSSIVRLDTTFKNTINNDGNSIVIIMIRLSFLYQNKPANR